MTAYYVWVLVLMTTGNMPEVRVYNTKHECDVRAELAAQAICLPAVHARSTTPEGEP